MSLLINSEVYKQNLVTNDDYIYKNSIWKNQLWDEKVCETISTLMRDKSEFVDVGANIGLVSIGVRLKTLDQWKTISKIHCFEPNNEIFGMLKKNTALLKNVELYPLALSDKFHLCNMKFHPQNNGCSFISNVIDENGVNEIKYDFQTHDHLFENDVQINIPTFPLDFLMYRFSDVSVIKIDVEGFECRVLEGSKSFLDKFKPHIVIEVLEENKDRCKKLMLELKYEFIQHISNQDYLFSPST